MPFYIFVALSSFLFSLLGTRLAILGLRKRIFMLDRISRRATLATPAPRGGGIVLVISVVIGLLMADINYAVILAVFLLAALSLMDGLIGIPVLVRLLVQMLAVAIPLSILHKSVFDGLFPLWLDKSITGALWIWLINLFGSMDEVEGLCVSEMLSVSGGLCLIGVLTDVFPNSWAGYSLVLACAGCGFLWWNWHPAKILLGDVGGIPVGYLLGYLLVLAALAGYGFTALILPAYYLADGAITVLSRLIGRFKGRHEPYEYYYQKAIHRGRRQDSVTRYVFGINLLLILLATFSALHPDIAIFDLAMAYMSVFMLLGFFAHTEHNPQHEQL